MEKTMAENNIMAAEVLGLVIADRVFEKMRTLFGVSRPAAATSQAREPGRQHRSENSRSCFSWFYLAMLVDGIVLGAQTFYMVKI
jgi:hypothetical protein